MLGPKQAIYDAKRVSIVRIEAEGFNLNISRYISTALAETEIDLMATHAELTAINAKISDATRKHNAFLRELGLPILPGGEVEA